MGIPEIFGKAANSPLEKALRIIKVSGKNIESSIKKKNFIIKSRNYDVVMDYKPKINFLVLYLSPKKSSKKLLKSIKPGTLEFRSFLVYLGKLKVGSKNLDIRLGAYGYSSSELGKAMMKGFKVKRKK